MKPRVCELCNGEASVYCISDSAFLCFPCDASVHQANFLVARHLRRIICPTCKGFDGPHFSGVGLPARLPISSFCRFCNSGDPPISESADSYTASSTSTCISSSNSIPAHSDSRSRKPAAGPAGRGGDRRETAGGVRVKAEGILLNWCRRLGWIGVERSESTGAISLLLLPLALQAFETCWFEFTVLPLRVCLAASLWFAATARASRDGSEGDHLKKLVECSGVPGKLILLAESRLRSVVNVKKLKPDEHAEEGWAES